MTLFEWRKNSTLPVHETDMIIQHICNLNRTDIILKEHNYELNAKQISAMTSLSQRRQESLEPIQYLLGYTYFYGRKFFVTPDVLIPRFDTETLIEAVKPIIKKKINESSKNPEKLKILDLCTGSGCIICTLAEDTFIQQNAAFSASDISEKALTVAKRNALGLPINFIQSDLFENINDTFDIIVSNPPYISQKEMDELDKEVFDYEPHLALFGGIDGLDIYRRIASEIQKYTKKNSHVFLEIGFAQGSQVSEIFSSKFSNCEIIKDIDGKDRVVHLFNS